MNQLVRKINETVRAEMFSDKSHYTSEEVRIELTQRVVDLVLKECLELINTTNLNKHTLTTYDHDLVEGVRNILIDEFKVRFGCQ